MRGSAKTKLFLSLKGLSSLSGCLRIPGEEPRETRFEELKLFCLEVLELFCSEELESGGRRSGS